MGVYIKNMEIPKSKGEYALRMYVHSDGTATIEGAYFRFEGEPFVAVPVPPHGDLIDRKIAYESLLDGMVMTGYQSRALDCIDEFYVPTIIPEEKMKEET